MISNLDGDVTHSDGRLTEGAEHALADLGQHGISIKLNSVPSHVSKALVALLNFKN